MVKLNRVIFFHSYFPFNSEIVFIQYKNKEDIFNFKKACLDEETSQKGLRRGNKVSSDRPINESQVSTCQQLCWKAKKSTLGQRGDGLGSSGERLRRGKRDEWSEDPG